MEFRGYVRGVLGFPVHKCVDVLEGTECQYTDVNPIGAIRGAIRPDEPEAKVSSSPISSQFEPSGILVGRTIGEILNEGGPHLRLDIPRSSDDKQKGGRDNGNGTEG